MMLTSTLNPWKIILAILVGVFLAGMLLSFIIAARRVSRVVDVDYYRHGLRYGKTARGTANEGMGWTMSASLRGGNLQVQVRDERGAPIAGGKLRFEPERLQDAASLQGSCTLALAESAPGVFSAPQPPTPRGDIHGTLFFTRGDAVATRKLVLLN